MYNQNYFDVKVAGESDITFSLCAYSNGANLAVSNLVNGASGSFDTEDLKGIEWNDIITYYYESGAIILRFTLVYNGQDYFHGIKVSDHGTISESPVVNEQAEMDGIRIVISGHPNSQGRRAVIKLLLFSVYRGGVNLLYYWEVDYIRIPR